MKKRYRNRLLSNNFYKLIRTNRSRHRRYYHRNVRTRVFRRIRKSSHILRLRLRRSLRYSIRKVNRHARQYQFHSQRYFLKSSSVSKTQRVHKPNHARRRKKGTVKSTILGLGLACQAVMRVRMIQRLGAPA